MKTEHDIDQLFKKGLSDPKIPFNEMDWKNMEQKLDVQRKKRGIAFWIPAVSGIAAALLILLFWVLFTRVTPDKAHITNRIANQNTTPKTGNKLPGSLAIPVKAGEENKKHIVIIDPSDVLPFSDTALVNPLTEKKSSTPAIVSPRSADEGPQAKKSHSEVIAAQKSSEVARNSSRAEKEDQDELLRNIRKKMDASFGQQKGLTLSVMAAPDISTAKQSMSSKISSNVGVLATYGLTRKFSVTSGAIYSRKFYNSGGVAPQSNTYTSGAAWQVNADCNVLDIPLNVNYKVLEKKGLSVSINTGLSSYFMLKEKYTFITGNAGPTQQVSNLEINNQNQHLFGVANIAVSFEHRISKGISVGVQPFVKLPLTGIGYGNADLKSTGMSFSLNLGLFPAKKSSGYAALKF